jgi:hypothetical protein
MKTRNVPRSLLSTYVKSVKLQDGETRYETLIVNAKTHEKIGCTKKTVKEAVSCLKQKMGVR